MIVEGAGWRKKTKDLTFTADKAVSTDYGGSYFGGFHFGDEKVPPSVDIKAHRFKIVEGLFLNMDEVVEMLGEKLEEPALEEIIAASGLKRHIGSMEPKLGGAMIDEELNAYYLTPREELEPCRPNFNGGINEAIVPPFITMGTQYAQARISAYDFPGMLSYTMSNTALQHMINISSLTRPQNVDPRLALIDSFQSEPIMSGV